MGLKDAILHYAESAKNHTGLHYVPSFNDLCTNSADDCEDCEAENAKSGKSGLGFGASAAATQAKSPAKSNKTDTMPGPDPITGTADLHKIGRAMPGADRKHMPYDKVTSPPIGSPASVMQYILDAEKRPKTDVHVSSSAPERTAYVIGMDTKKMEMPKPKAKAAADDVQFDQFLKNTLDNA